MMEMIDHQRFNYNKTNEERYVSLERGAVDDWFL